MARYSEAHNKAHQKWEKANRYRINAYFPIEWKEKIAKKSEEYGSVNAFLIHLVKQSLEIEETPKE